MSWIHALTAISWEYPGRPGADCNTQSEADSDNFLLFLQELRSTEPSLILSADAGDVPFAGKGQVPLTDVSKFSEVLDFLTIMNYDIWGNSDAVAGPNSPLDDSCAPSDKQHGSAMSAV